MTDRPPIRSRLRARRSERAHGFTLVELMMVVALIAVLAVVALPQFADLITKSQHAATKGNLGMLRTAISIYYSDNEGVYPGDNLDSLMAGSKYLQVIPQTRIAPLHPTTRMVHNNLTLGCAAIFDNDAGTWCYWNWVPGSCFGNEMPQGSAWICCKHSDLRGGLWTSF